jgi:hypothetical protein
MELYSGETHLLFFLNLQGGTLVTVATTGLLYQPWMIGDGDCGEIGGMKIWRKPAPAPLCPPPIWLDLGLNPGCHGRKPVTNRLSYGVAETHLTVMLFFFFRRRLLRAMLGYGNTVSCRNIFKELGILPLVLQYLFSLLLFVSYNKALFSSNIDSIQFNLLHP